MESFYLSSNRVSMESKTTNDSIKRLNVETLSGAINSYFLYGTMGQPIVFFGFSSGKIFLISFNKSSGIRLIVLTCFLLKHY